MFVGLVGAAAALVLAGVFSRPAAPSITPDSSGRIPWEQAEWLILHGDVDMVSQTHSRQVGITMRDGTNFHAVEPRIDDVLRLVRARSRWFGRRIVYMTE